MRVGDDVTAEVTRAAHVLAALGLADAFGHVSARIDAETYLITPPEPLADARPDRLVRVGLGASPPSSAPREAWLHSVAYRRRPELTGVARAQPPAAFAAGAMSGTWRPVHGHGALLGPAIPIHDVALLARDQARADAVVTTLGDGRAVVMRASGALTVAPEGPGAAVAAMWVVETAARMRCALVGARGIRELSAEEAAAWTALAPELLSRIWSYLASRPPA